MVESRIAQTPLALAKRFAADLFKDGYKLFGLVGPFASATYWIAKLFFGATVVLRDWSWAWGFLPVSVWLAVAYYRRWSAHAAMLKGLDARIEIIGLHRDADVDGGITSIAIRNLSVSAGLSKCLVRIEKLTDMATGAEVLSHWPLRTENQTDGRIEGRFNLDPGMTKRIDFCMDAMSASYGIRILGAGNKSRKLPMGKYAVDLLVTSPVTPPVPVHIEIDGKTARIV